MAGSLKFVHLCDLLEKISHAPRDKKKKNLHTLINFVRENSGSLGHSFFSLARLLCPNLDKERKAYGIGETVLAKIYISILCLPRDGVDAKKLTKYSSTTGSSASDFAEVAYWVLKSRLRDGGKLTVEEVDAHLDKIAIANKTASEAVLTEILLKMSADEQKWFIRILLKNLRLGLSESSILKAIHPDAKELYDLCNSLRRVCEKLQDPSKRLHEMDITLFLPCSPMLSERCDVLKTESILNKAPFYYVEKKHDGERFMIHIDNGSYRYFSRKPKDYSEGYGVSAMSGNLTPLLAKQIHADVHTCILDGEMMKWNTNLKSFGSQGRIGKEVDVKRLTPGGAYRPCFCVFDILMLNGNVLTNKPFQERTECLKKIFTPLEGVIMETPQKCVKSSKEVEQCLNDAIDNQEEGLILKHPFSVYKPSTRTGGWYKVKPEYTVGQTDDLDLIIMGAYHGDSGKYKSSYLLGVAVPSSAGAEPLEFHSVGKVGSGLSYSELQELFQKISPHFIPVQVGQMPSGLFWSRERPDFWIQPCNSQILQVKASEIVESKSYKTGYTLRHPVIQNIRYDKNWSECCTIAEFEQLRLANAGKLAIRHVSSSDSALTSPNKRSRTKVAPLVGLDYRAADLTNVAVKGSLLSGRELCVHSGSETISKQDLERRICEQGGTVVQHRGPETFCVVVGKKDFRFKNLLEQGNVDVVTVDWCLNVLNGERSLEWTPQDLLAMSSKTRDDMNQKYDSFGDSYKKPITVDELQLSLEKVSQQDCEETLLPSEMEELDKELFSGVNEFAIFRRCFAHFISTRQESISKAMFRFQGGTVSDLGNPDLTHIVIHVNDDINLSRVKKLIQNCTKKCDIVTFDWIDSCWLNRQRLNEANFYPKSL